MHLIGCGLILVFVVAKISKMVDALVTALRSAEAAHAVALEVGDDELVLATYQAAQAAQAACERACEMELAAMRAAREAA